MFKMPRRNTHLLVASVIGFCLPELLSSLGIIIENSIFFRVLYLLFSSFGAYIPDRLEPKRSYDHRGFFHSFSFLTILSLSSAILINKNIFLFSMILGYISHLLLDLTTPKKLPLI